MVLGDTQDRDHLECLRLLWFFCLVMRASHQLEKFKKKNPINPLKASNEVNTCILAIVGKTYQENRSICSKIP